MRENHQKSEGEIKFLGGQILANNNFGFGVYGFDIKKRTQSRWFSSSIMLKEIDYLGKIS